MRFMVMHKQTEEMEQGLLPDPAAIEAVSALLRQSLQEQVFVSGEGLKPTSQRVRLQYSQGQRTVTQGPFSDARELLAGFVLLRVRSRDEALSWCDRLAAGAGEVELFLGPVVEPWDLGLMPPPKNPPLRFLVLRQQDQRGAADTPAEPELAARNETLLAELRAAGVLQASGSLHGTRQGARLHYQGAKPRSSTVRSRSRRS